GGEGAGIAAEEVARELVGEDEVGERSARPVQPELPLAAVGGLPGRQEAVAYLGVGRVVGGIPAALADIMQPECEDGFGLGHRLLPACHHSIVAGWRREGQRHGDGVASVSCLASMTASTAMAPAEGESG